MRPWKIGIVGGGPGGLFTAYLLERLASVPVSVTILEAADRLGGKVRTCRFSSAPVRYEAGAAEFYDYSGIDEDPLRELIETLGLPTLPLGGGSIHLGGHMLASLDDIRVRLGPGAASAVERFDRLAKDALSPREFYEAMGPPAVADSLDGGFHHLLDTIQPALARGYVERLIHSDLATEPDQTSLGYGLDNYLMNNPDYLRLYCIAGGNEQLIEALAARIDAEIRLATAVVSVEGLPGGEFRLGAIQAGRSVDCCFDAVVLALPIDPLSRLTFSGAVLDAAMRRHLREHDHPAHYLRISVLFDRPFWRERGPFAGSDDAFWMLDAFGGCCLYDESSREPEQAGGVLGWLLGGQPAAERDGLPDDVLVAEALAALPPSLRDATLPVRESRVHRWTGAVSGLPGGWKPRSFDERHRPDPVGSPRLFLVGDYLFDSTLNGVLDSADYVAHWLAGLLEERREKTA
jgi:monoamine oxidase